jgi:signal peptidase I
VRDVSPPSDLSGDDQSAEPGASGAANQRGRRAAARAQTARQPKHLRSNGRTADDPATRSRAAERAEGGPASDRDHGDDDTDDDRGDGKHKPRRRLRRTLLEWAAVIAGGIVIALLVEAFFIQAFWIPSPSMVPTLEVGDRVLVNKLSYKLHDVHRGDVVVFSRPPGASQTEDGKEIKDLIKRVIAIGGDTVEAKQGRVYVNDKAIDEPYLEPGTPTNDLPRQRIPDGHVFVMGDNRTNSEDSRVFGPIDESDIVGRAFIRVLPITNIGWL